MAYAYFLDKERFKGCGLCVGICPKNVLEISNKVNAKGYFPASGDDQKLGNWYSAPLRSM